MRMGPIGSLVKKEFSQFRRDPVLRRAVAVLPIFGTLLMGYAVITDVRHLPTVFLDQDCSAASREIENRFFSTEYFDPAGRVQDIRKLREMIDSGRASVGIIIPTNFTRDLVRGRVPAVGVVIDGQDANSGTIAMGYAFRILHDYAAGFRRKAPTTGAGTRRPPRVTRGVIRVWYNPNLKTTYFMIPGIIAILLTMITSILSGMSVVRERETGTLEQLLVTPIKPYQLLLGKLIPFGLIGLAVMTYSMAFGILWFGIPVAGNLLLLLGFTVIFLFSTLGEGLFVSTMSTTQQQSMFFTWFMNVFAILMSGVMFPIENMPRTLQYLTYLNPLRYYVAALRGILLKGLGIEYLWRELVILAVFGIIIFGMAAARFNKRIG